MKFGHQIGCISVNNLENSNDIDMNSNDLEITFNSVVSSYLTFGQSYCHLISAMKVTTPYYLGQHTLVYIFKKICSKKAIFNHFYE